MNLCAVLESIVKSLKAEIEHSLLNTKVLNPEIIGDDEKAMMLIDTSSSEGLRSRKISFDEIASDEKNDTPQQKYTILRAPEEHKQVPQVEQPAEVEMINTCSV